MRDIIGRLSNALTLTQASGALDVSKGPGEGLFGLERVEDIPPVLRAGLGAPSTERRWVMGLQCSPTEILSHHAHISLMASPFRDSEL